VLSCCRAAQPGPPRVAYAIGRRTGNAVERNRVRRRLRHVVRNHSERLLRDHQYLIGAQREALRASTVELTDAWLGLVERAHAELSEGGLR
jgi:ribonuclease P protein component